MKHTRPGGQSIEQLASEWVVRSAGPLSPESQAELNNWLAADSRHAETYSRLMRAWAVFDRAQRKGAAGAIAVKVAQCTRRHRRRLQAVTVVGALALGGVLYTFHPSLSSAPASAKVEAIAESIRKLPDGSIVELHQGAEIAVQYTDAFRRVLLAKGEAHFRVAKNPARPFLVQAGSVEVAAIGTAFTVQLASREVEVVVTEGRVAVDRESHRAPGALRSIEVPPILVNAGNRVVVNTAEDAISPPLVKAMSEPEIEKRLAWRASLLEFEGMELGQAVVLMNRANRVQISLADRSIGALRVSGTFRADNPEGFVRIVESTFDLKTERRGEYEMVLRRP
jgi:transmembrane sensor